ncbi:MAG: dephospho-CoA kinase [Nitrospirota bacterium]
MLIVGLTGGIASGKSLAAGIFKDLGAQVIDADRIAHQLLEPDEQPWKEVVEYFGESILLPDKCIDRKKLGEVIFNDPQKRLWLNSILHPRIFEAFQSQIKRLKDRQPNSIVIFDAILLIETGYHRNLDKIIVVYAEQEQQIERLTARDGFTREQALARIQSQMPLKEKRSYADYIVDNTQSREYAEQQVRKIFQQLRQEEELQRSPD